MFKVMVLIPVLLLAVACQKEAENVSDNLSTVGGYCKLSDKDICVEFNNYNLIEMLIRLQQPYIKEC